ncbi:MAG: PD-(D/E)XK nuclease family protein [Caldilineaceae bacterium]|nr:PD-(D/E)XK nuclease family protein [Caldilineaceae bacterium]
MNDATDIQRIALEAFLIDNPELEQLEELLGQFNIFEAIGAVRQEVRHSDFLAFLLDPSQPHGLDDLFAQRLLQHVVANLSVPNIAPTRIDLALRNFGNLEVRREWRNIDLLLLDEEHQTAVLIENKVDSNEHSDQLIRYREIVAQNFPTWQRFGIYLTPDGDEPSDDFYAPLSYGELVDLLEALTGARASTLGPDVLALMRHYIQMIRRHILTDSEIADLCRRIYRKHQKALDLIYEHRPDLQLEIQELCAQLVNEEEDLVLDHSTKTRIRFAPRTWNQILDLKQGNGWTPSGHMLLFEWVNSPTRLTINLVIGPGPDSTRARVYAIAQKHQPPFKPKFKSVGKNWRTIYQHIILSPKAYEEASIEDLEPQVRKMWAHFLDHDLPELKRHVSTEFDGQQTYAN